MREKLSRLIVIPFTDRITPACAGKTEYDDVLKEITRDHPRVCGKNSNRWMSVHPPEGSPPRVREKHMRKVCALNNNRITPACAGKTAGNQLAKVHGWDHPRVCGKNLLSSSLFLTRVGSPPRVREKQDYKDINIDDTGITPACAGKTLRAIKTKET